jgi:hypothetical protein
MENTEQAMLVFKDQAGGYYLLPQELLERGRVPAERTAEVEQLMTAAQADAEGADTQGHGFWFGIAVAVVTRAGFDIGTAVANHYLNSSSGGGSAHWAYFESAYNQAKLQ